MEPEGGIPADDAGLLRRSLDGMPAGVITLDRDDVIVQCSRSVRSLAPSLTVGAELRPALEALTHREMVDRLMIRREVATFPGVVGGREHHWMVWGEGNHLGERVMTVWETDWNEVMNERRAAFTMAASHELRGPLTTLRGFAEILNMDTGNLTPEQVEAVAIIERTARHLDVLVDDVFDLSRNSFGELRLNLSETELAVVLEAVVAGIRPRVEQRGQSIELRIEGDLPPIDADPARTRQMLSNLINNASVHNPEGTTISVTAVLEGERVEVKVADDGVGLPFDQAEEAFRSFRRGNATRSGDRTGSGIGLSITKRLIQLHRGGIDVESEPDSGTRFTLWFPADYETALTPGEPGPV